MRRLLVASWAAAAAVRLLLFLLHPTEVDAQGGNGLSPGVWVKDEKAKCLDGSPPVYYHRPGTGAGATKWLIYYEGGGWCASTQECYDRSLTDLGSSLAYDKAKPLEWDMLTSDPIKNPLLHNWHVVFVKYCDGGFFSSDRMDTEVHRGRTLYYRGKYIQEAIFRDLRANRGMDRATEVIFGGCSAGAMATLVQVDHWANSTIFPPSVTKMTAVPDSGFLLAYDGPGRCQGYETRMVQFYDFMSSSLEWAIPQGCLAAHKKDPWRCVFFLENTIPHVKTPLFVIQSKYDKWQREALFCGKPDDVAGNNRFGRMFEQRFYAVVGRNAKDGYLLDSCVRHCGSWNLVESAEGLTQEAAFRQWYTALPPIRVAPDDTPLSVGHAITTLFIQEGLLPPLAVANETTAAATSKEAAAMLSHAAAKAADIWATILHFFNPHKHRRGRRHRHRRHSPPPEEPAFPVVEAGTPLSPFRYNNTGLFPCQACCRSGWQREQAPQQPAAAPVPAKPPTAGQGAAAVVGMHWQAEGVEGEVGDPVEGEGGGEKEMAEVEIDAMGNVIVHKLPGSRLLRRH